VGLKLEIMSDLHLEFGDCKLAPSNADVVILAGDMAPGLRGLNSASTLFGDRPVVYVAGNHEYYNHSLPALTEEIRQQAKGSTVHFLENSEIVIRGVRFLGCTLWTDFELFGREFREIATMLASEVMNDYRVIRSSLDSGKFRPDQSRQLHLESRAWLGQALDRPFDGPTVVVTHHAPSMKSIDPEDWDDPIVAAYASNLESLMDGSKVKLWIHGHTHRSVDYIINGTRIVSNQRGYPEQSRTGFQPGMVLEV